MSIAQDIENIRASLEGLKRSKEGIKDLFDYEKQQVRGLNYRTLFLRLAVVLDELLDVEDNLKRLEIYKELKASEPESLETKARKAGEPFGGMGGN